MDLLDDAFPVLDANAVISTCRLLDDGTQRSHLPPNEGGGGVVEAATGGGERERARANDGISYSHCQVIEEEVNKWAKYSLSITQFAQTNLQIINQFLLFCCFRYFRIVISLVFSYLFISFSLYFWFKPVFVYRKQLLFQYSFHS